MYLHGCGRGQEDFFGFSEIVPHREYISNLHYNNIIECTPNIGIYVYTHHSCPQSYVCKCVLLQKQAYAYGHQDYRIFNFCTDATRRTYIKYVYIATDS